MKKLGHVPALDGFRGIAIAAVVLYHYFGWPRGGYLGVDLFFVLSGFLITTLILQEHAATGRLSLKGFYLRRGRRLLPALFTMLSIFALIDLANGRDPTRPVLAGVFYCTNFFYTNNPLVPLWSLAQE